MHHFDDGETERLLDYPTLVATLVEVIQEYSRQDITSPERSILRCGDGRGMLLSMPCQAHDLLVHKLVTVYSGNKAKRLPTIQGSVACFDAGTGSPLFTLDAATVTARRTAAVTMVGMTYLRPSPPATCLLIGTGMQAFAHAKAALELFPGLTLHVQGRSEAAAEAFCTGVGRAGRVVPASPSLEPEVVIAATSSLTPVFDRPSDPGRLVIGVGSYRPDMVEIGSRTVHGSQVYVDDPVGAPGEAGDILAAGTDWSTVRSLATGLAEPPDPSRPVFFKSVGCAAWDLAACRTANRNLARRESAFST